MGVVAYFTASIIWNVSAIALVSATVLLFYDWNGSWGLPRFREVFTAAPDNATHGIRLWRLANLAMPLGVVTLFTALNSNMPRFAVEQYLGRDSLGVFAVVAYVYAAASVVASALAQGATATLARRAAEGDALGFVRIMGRLGGIAALAGFLGVAIAKAFGAEILTLLYRREYAEHADLLVWMMVAAGLSFVAAVATTGMNALRVFNLQPLLYGITLAATTLTSYVWVPRYGLQGAAFGVIVGVTIQMIGSAVICAYPLIGRPQANEVELRSIETVRAE
jgi:O-antigen/teichoic acid export membrane protein